MQKTAKPTNVEAQRILAIMTELREKLSFLSVVTPEILEGLQGEEAQSATELCGPEILTLITTQIRLEEAYVRDHTASDGTFAHAEGGSEEVREEQKQLHKNTLELCRRMKSIPGIVVELRNFQETRPAAAILFLKTLADMQELMLKRLTTTLEEDNSRKELLQHYKNRADDANKRRQTLEKDLNHVRRECERAQQQRSEILTKLRADLFEVKGSKLQEMTNLRTRYENRMKEHQEAFDARREELEKKIAALKESNSKLKANSQDEESQKKKQANRFDTDVRTVIQQYDGKVREMAYHLNENNDNYKKEMKQLDELREHFSKVDAEQDFISNEEAISDARKAKLAMERERRNESAARVQAFFRGIIQREQYQSMKKANKKKGGKKGKKK